MDVANVLSEGQDLAEAAQRARLPSFRDADIQAAVDALIANRSVLLVGPLGVGKTAVLHGVAQRLAELEIGTRRFTTTQIMSGTRYLGEWESKLTGLMSECERSNTILNVVDVWNLPTVGTTSNSKANLLDAMQPRLAEGRLRLISEVTAEQLLEMHRFAKLLGRFDIVRIEPLSAAEMRVIADNEADAIGLSIERAARERLFELCETFHAANAGPGPVLDLIGKVRDYRDQKLAIGEDATITPLFVEKVFAIHSGLPLFVVSRSESKSAGHIRDWFRERIVGQEAAIEAVVEMIAFYKARLHDTGKPIGSFLFVGPTGVGKTELARALAEFFFGSDRRMLRFDMSEFTDFHSFEMLVGSAQASPERPARLIDPVRLQPFQVLLFDELEKAHRNIQDLFLQLLDEGRLTTPKGETVSFRNAIIVATSNVGAFEGMTTAIGFAGNGGGYDADKAMGAIEMHFRPEFLNRFQHVVLFHPLTQQQAARIARADLRATLKREGIAGRNLIVDVHDAVIDHVLAAGFNPRYGGRGIKREMRRQVILPIATLLMEQAPEAGSLIEVSVTDGRVRVRVADTPDSLHAKAEKAPIRTRTGDRLTRDDINKRTEAARAACADLAREAGLERLRGEIEDIDRTRKEHTFWRDLDSAGGASLAQHTRALETVSRIEWLQGWGLSLAGAVRPATTRADLARLSDRLLHLEAAIATARREIVIMGPDGYWDALVEIAPVGTSASARDFVFRLYQDWAKDRQVEVVMLREPMAADEPIAVVLRGHFAHGYLKGEAGHHRVRQQDKSAVARVTVAPLSQPPGPVEFAEQRPLKMIGQFGGKVRSRVSVLGGRLVLQNARSLSENRELMRDIAASWPREQPPTAERVRLYDLDGFLVRDYLAGADFTRKDILSPKPFHDLLCTRLDKAAEGEDRPDASPS